MPKRSKKLIDVLFEDEKKELKLTETEMLRRRAIKAELHSASVEIELHQLKLEEAKKARAIAMEAEYTLLKDIEDRLSISMGDFEIDIEGVLFRR